MQQSSDSVLAINGEQCEQLKALIETMQGDCLWYSFYMLAHQEDELPVTLQDYIKSNERDEDIALFTELGRQHDAESRRLNSRRYPAFPISWFDPSVESVALR
jgi:hypothetical protein